MATLILFGLMLIIMLMRVALPFGAKTEGKLVKEIRLSLRESLLFHRVSIYAIGFVLLLTALFGLVSRPIEFVVVLAAFAIVMIPVRYRVTTQGIALNNVVFRPWGDFTAVERGRRRLRLVSRAGLRPFDLPLLGKRQEEALSVLRRLVTGAGQRSKEGVAAKRTSRGAEKPWSGSRLLRGVSARHLALLVVPLALVALAVSGGVALAQGPDDTPGPKADQSGLTTGTGADLDDVANLRPIGYVTAPGLIAPQPVQNAEGPRYASGDIAR